MIDNGCRLSKGWQYVLIEVSCITCKLCMQNVVCVCLLVTKNATKFRSNHYCVDNIITLLLTCNIYPEIRPKWLLYISTGTIVLKMPK